MPRAVAVPLRHCATVVSSSILIALIALTGCGPREAAPAASSASVPSAASQPAPGATTAFQVDVGVSDAAGRRLAEARETLVVSADYFGEPTIEAVRDNRLRADEPWLTLDRREIELAKPGIARFAAVHLDPERLGWIENGEPQLLINVYSGRKSSPDNLLDCSTYQDSLRQAARDGVRITCKLIGE